MKRKTVDNIALALMIFGGINWGMMGAFRVNLIARVVGNDTFGARVFYLLIGLATLYFAVTSVAFNKR